MSVSILISPAAANFFSELSQLSLTLETHETKSLEVYGVRFCLWPPSYVMCVSQLEAASVNVKLESNPVISWLRVYVRLRD